MDQEKKQEHQQKNWREKKTLKSEKIVAQQPSLQKPLQSYSFMEMNAVKN